MNARALAGQVQELDAAYAEAQTQARIADEARAEAEEARQRVEVVTNGITERAAALWSERKYDGALMLIEAAEQPAIALQILHDGPYNGDIERMQRDLDEIKDDQ